MALGFESSWRFEMASSRFSAAARGCRPMAVLGVCVWALTSEATATRPAADSIDGRLLAYWVQVPAVRANGLWLARAIVDNQGTRARCPEASDGSGTKPMKERNNNGDPSNFPVKVCELAVSPAKPLRLTPQDGSKVPVSVSFLPFNFRLGDKIAVVGDSGCRGALGGQDCSSIPEGFPFGRIATALSGLGPSVTVHVGDYLYRQCALQTGAVPCDTWEGWRADFFEPARPLLEAAPWVFSRGNHEQCGEQGRLASSTTTGAVYSWGGRGWFLFLDPSSKELGDAHLAHCPPDDLGEEAEDDIAAGNDATPPYPVDLPFGPQGASGTVRLLMVDSAVNRNYQYDFGDLETFIDTSASGYVYWLVTHRPLIAVTGFTRDGDGDLELSIKYSDTYLLGAYRNSNAVKANTSMFLSGHIHLGSLAVSSESSSASTQAHRFAPQLIVGSSGVDLRGHPGQHTLCGFDGYAQGNAHFPQPSQWQGALDNSQGFALITPSAGTSSLGKIEMVDAAGQPGPTCSILPMTASGPATFDCSRLPACQ